MKTISAKEFDEKFDNGEDISEYLDWENARSGIDHFEPVDLKLPLDLVNRIDDEAENQGVSRQAFLHRLLDEKLNELQKDASREKRDVAE